MIRFVLDDYFIVFISLSLCSGFLGFEIRYSDMLENISVTLSARSGTVLLSSMMMQFWQPTWSGLAVRIGDGDQKELIIEGSVEVVNLALQSIQYLGYCHLNYYSYGLFKQYIIRILLVTCFFHFF